MRTDSTDALRQLERRVAELEGAHARWRRAALAAPIAVVAWILLTGQAGARVVDATSFIVRDDAGVARAQLGLAEDVPALSLYGRDGLLRAALAVELDGPIVSLYTNEGSPRVVFGEREGSAFVVLRDANGAPRAAMAVQPDGEPSLYLLDDKMNPLFRKP